MGGGAPRAGHHEMVDAGDVELAERGPTSTFDDVPVSLRRRIEAAPPFATCPYCDRASCVRCKIPAHSLVTCAEVASGDAAATLTSKFVSATSKACPRCAFRITHSHGHACHHIMPGSGCPNCGHHFCFSCLRRGTSGSVCGCRLFCSNDGILANIVKLPYPRDARCGCTFCNICRKGMPCEQCSGRCVVCLGVVPPGPNAATEVDAWTAPTA